MLTIAIPALIAGNLYGLFVGILTASILFILSATITTRYMNRLSMLNDDQFDKELRPTEGFWRLKRQRVFISVGTCIAFIASGIDMCWISGVGHYTCASAWGDIAWYMNEIYIVAMIMSGVCLIAYPGYAEAVQWPIGNLYYKEDPPLLYIGAVLQVYGFYQATAYGLWWHCFVYVAVGWFFGLGFTCLFRHYTPFAALVAGIVACLFVNL